jgi:hypothetical protein
MGCPVIHIDTKRDRVLGWADGLRRSAPHPQPSPPSTLTTRHFVRSGGLRRNMGFQPMVRVRTHVHGLMHNPAWHFRRSTACVSEYSRHGLETRGTAALCLQHASTGFSKSVGSWPESEGEGVRSAAGNEPIRNLFGTARYTLIQTIRARNEAIRRPDAKVSLRLAGGDGVSFGGRTILICGQHPALRKSSGP